MCDKSKTKAKVKVDVDASGIDRAIEKINYMAEKMWELKLLADDLNSHLTNLALKIDIQS